MIHTLTHEHPIFRRSVATLGSIAIAAALVGCAWFRGEEKTPTGDTVTTRPAIAETSYSSDRPLPTALQPGGRPVAQGQLPLVYLVENAGNIRITNVASGEQIAAFPAQAAQIVRVEARGVLLQNKPIMGAQLVPSVYAIFVDEPGAGNLSVTQSRSAPIITPPKPASQPATSRPANATQ